MPSPGKRWVRHILHAGLPLPRCIRPVIRVLYRAGVVAVESLAFLRKVLWVEPVLRSVCDEVGPGLRAERLPYMRGPGRIRLGHHVNLSGRSCFYFMRSMAGTPALEIGNHVFIGNGCTLSAGTHIRIGDRCLLSAGVRIHDNDGHPLDAERRRRGDTIRPDECAPVMIGTNVWLGAGSTVLKGVTIGDDAVIGTGAVVTRDVPAGVVVAGNPAQIVRRQTVRRESTTRSRRS